MKRDRRPTSPTVLPNLKRINDLFARSGKLRKEFINGTTLKERTLYTILSGREEVRREHIDALVIEFNKDPRTQTNIDELTCTPGRLFGFPKLSRDFVPIKTCLTALEQALIENWTPDDETERSSPHTSITILAGPPGTGKTSSATHMCTHRRIRTRFPDGIFFFRWGPLPNTERIRQSLARSFPKAMQQFSERPFAHEIEELTTFIKTKRVLLVLDDLHDVADLAELETVASLLVTTQKVDLAESLGDTVVSTDKHRPTASECLKILESSSGDSELDNSTLEELLRLTGSHPYALNAIGRSKRFAGISWTTVVEHATSHVSKLSPPPRQSYEHQHLLNPFEDAIGLLPMRTKERLLQLSVVPEAATISLPFLELLWSRPDKSTKPVSATIKELLGTSLLLNCEFPEDTASFRLHTLISAVIKSINPPNPGAHAHVADCYLRKYGEKSLSDVPDPYFHENYVSHLVLAGRLHEAEETLLDIKWMAATARRTRSVRSICEGLRLLNNRKTKELEGLLELAGEAIRIDPNQLPAQILGRTHSRFQQHAVIHKLRRQILETTWDAVLLPTNACLASETDSLSSPVSTDHSQVEALGINGKILASGGESPLGLNCAQLWLVPGKNAPDRLEYLSKIALDDDSVTAITPAPNGSFFYAGTKRGRLSVLIVDTELLTFFKQSHTRRVYCLLCIRHFLVSGSGDGQLILWDSRHRKKLHAITISTRSIADLATGTTGERIAAITGNICVVYSLVRGKLKEETRRTFNDDFRLTRIVAGDTPKTWFLGGSSGRVYRYREDSEDASYIVAHPRNVTVLKRLHGNSKLISGSVGQPLRIWDMTTLHEWGAPIPVEQGRILKEIVVTKDSQQVIAGFSHRDLRVIPLGSTDSTFPGLRHRSPLVALMSLRGVKQLVSVSRDGHLLLHTLDSPKVLRQSFVRLETNEEATAAVLQDGEKIVWLGTSQGRLIRYSWIDDEQHFATQVHEAALTSLAFDPQESRLYSAGKDNRVFYLEPKSGSMRLVVSRQNRTPTVLAANKGRLLTGWNDGSIWEQEIPKPPGQKLSSTPRHIQQHQGRITSLQFATGGYCFSASSDGMLKRWKIADKIVEGSTYSHGSRISAISAISSGQTLVTDDSRRAITWCFHQQIIERKYLGDFPFTCAARVNQTVYLGDSDGYVHQLTNLPPTKP